MYFKAPVFRAEGLGSILCRPIRHSSPFLIFLTLNLICFTSGQVGFPGRSSPEKQSTDFSLTQHSS